MNVRTLVKTVDKLKEKNIEETTFNGLTTQQSQLLRLLYQTGYEPPNSTISSNLSLHSSFNCSSTCRRCDSFSVHTTPMSLPISIIRQKEEFKSDYNVMSEGEVILGMVIEIARYLVLPFLEFMVFLLCLCLRIRNEDSEEKTVALKGPPMVGPPSYQNLTDQASNESSIDSSGEISIDIPTVIESHRSLNFLLTKLIDAKEQLEIWLQTKNIFYFSKNGKSCRELVRNEIRYLSKLSRSEISQATSLNDLIKYWRT